MTEPKFKRVFAIVLDSVGTGNAPDAAKFDDEGADTLGDLGHAWQGVLSHWDGMAVWMRFPPVKTVWTVTGK